MGNVRSKKQQTTHTPTPTMSLNYLDRAQTFSKTSAFKMRTPPSNDIPRLQQFNLSNSMSAPTPNNISTVDNYNGFPEIQLFNWSPNRKKKRKSRSVKKQHTLKGNGVTDIFLSRKLTECIGIFWRNNIESLSPQNQLEVGVLIYFLMIKQCDDDFKLIFKNYSIEKIAKKLIYMITWLISSLTNDNIELQLTLRKLGKLHKNCNVKVQFFESYLSALHNALTQYFPWKYSIDIKYCLDKIMIVSCQIMVGKTPNVSSIKKQSSSNNINDNIDFNNASDVSPPPDHIESRTSSFIDIGYIQDFQEARYLNLGEFKNLDHCLLSDIGKEYFFRYLESVSCYEIVIFLQFYSEFKRSMSENQKFMVCKKVLKTSIDKDGSSAFPINIAYQPKMHFIRSMDYLDKQWKLHCAVQKDNMNKHQLELPTPFIVKNDLLDQMLNEMKKLLNHNHWRDFLMKLQDIQKVSSSNTQSKSMSIEPDKIDISHIIIYDEDVP